MINDQLKNLYQKYYNLNDIVWCGVVDEKYYQSANPKIIFVLREANSDVGGWSIPDLLNKNITDYFTKNTPLQADVMYTWRLAGVWAYSILNGFNSYDVLKQDKFVAEGLRAIAMTNIKKTPGNSAANYSQIRQCAFTDKDMLKQELQILNPDLIICGGTYLDLQICLDFKKMELATIDNKLYDYSVFKGPTKDWKVLEFWHPNIKNSRSIRTRQDTQIHLNKLITLL